MTKQERLEKLLPGGKTVMVPMDHGVSDGPIKGLEDMGLALQRAVDGGANATVIHKGIYRSYKDIADKLAVLVHISVSTNDGAPLRKVTVATPQEILDLGALGVSIHVNVANEHEPEMIKDMGRVSGECEKLGLPLLAMVYPRCEQDGKIVTFNDVEHVKNAARLAFELGADLVKVPYTGSTETFAEVVKSVNIPVIIAGGAKGSEEEMLSSIEGCINAGASGVSVGRNIFQADDMPGMIKKVHGVVHK